MRCGWKEIGLFLVLGGAAVSSSAQTVLSVDEAVKVARQRNLSLQRSSWDVAAKKRQADNAFGVLVPSLSLSTGLTRTNEATDIFGDGITPTWTAGNSATISLSIGGGLIANLKTVVQNYKSGLLTYELASRSLEKSVREAYVQLLLEKENLKLAKDGIALQERNVADTQAKYKNGLAPKLDVLTALVALEKLKPQYDDLETTFLNDLGQFKVYLGVPLTEDIALTGSLNEAYENFLNPSALSPKEGDSPDVQQARMTVESNRLSQESQDWGSWLPTLSLSYSKIPTKTDFFGTAGSWSDTTGGLSLQLSYSLDSLFPWTTSREKDLEAREAVRSSLSQLEETRTNSALNRTNDVRKIRQALKSLASLSLNVEQAQEAYDQSRDAYDHGIKSLTDFLSAQTDLETAKYNLLAERSALLTAVLELEYELNVPFGTLLGGNG